MNGVSLATKEHLTNNVVDTIRDSEIVARFEQLKSKRAVGLEFGISGWRVTQILRRNGINETRKPREWGCCERCGRARPRNRIRFCSKKCANEARQPERETKICQNCLKQFPRRVASPQWELVRFCQDRCKYEWRRRQPEVSVLGVEMRYEDAAKLLGLSAGTVRHRALQGDDLLILTSFALSRRHRLSTSTK